MNALQYAIPGEPVSARQFNALIDAIRALQNLEVGPGLEVGRSPSGNLRLNLTLTPFDALVPVVITAVHGPTPGPDYPSAYTYDVAGVRSSGLSAAGLTPALGRPAVDEEAAIYPAEVGCRAFLIRYRDETGAIAGADLFIPPGGKGAAPGSGHGYRGERLAFQPCDGEAAAGFSGGGGGFGALEQLIAALGVNHADRLLAPPDTGGMPAPPPSETPMAPTSLINVRQQVFSHAMVRLDLAQDAVRVVVPPEAIGASVASYLLQGPGAGSHTWSAAKLAVKAVIGDGQPVHFPIARTIPAGGGMLNPPLSEADLLGVSALHISKDSTTEASGSIADLDIGFAVLTPASVGPDGAVPVPDRIPSIAVSGAAIPAGPAAPAGD